MTPQEGLRFGNWLYLWLRAHELTASGQPRLVLHAPGMDEWLTTFPALRNLTLPLEELRFQDQRVWGDREWNQQFGEEFDRPALSAFVHDALEPQIPPGDTDTVVVNVRRGDYYESERLRARYAFDQAGYLKEALERIGPTPRIRLVSDDPEWCRENLDALFRSCADEVTYDPRGAVNNFLTIAGARRLIGTNSTFSYWGGYIADTVRTDAQVIMPWFHGRGTTRIDAYQVDPTWTIVNGYY